MSIGISIRKLGHGRFAASVADTEHGERLSYHVSPTVEDTRRIDCTTHAQEGAFPCLGVGTDCVVESGEAPPEGSLVEALDLAARAALEAYPDEAEHRVDIGYHATESGVGTWVMTQLGGWSAERAARVAEALVRREEEATVETLSVYNGGFR